MVSPVMYKASSEHRNETIPEQSSGSPNLGEQVHVCHSTRLYVHIITKMYRTLMVGPLPEDLMSKALIDQLTFPLAHVDGLMDYQSEHPACLDLANWVVQITLPVHWNLEHYLLSN